METITSSTLAEEDDRLTGCDGRYLATLVGRVVNVRLEKRIGSLGEGLHCDIRSGRVQSVTHERTEDAYKTVVRFEDGGTFSVLDWMVGCAYYDLDSGTIVFHDDLDIVFEPVKPEAVSA